MANTKHIDVKIFNDGKWEMRKYSITTKQSICDKFYHEAIIFNMTG